MARPKRDIAVGDVFGSLTVTRLIPGRKNAHPLAECRCACGSYRVPRQSNLRRGRAFSCKSCALKSSWTNRARVEDGERFLLAKETEYRSNSRQKDRSFGLTRLQFRALFLGSCRYCGISPSRGIDRIDSAIGYSTGNTVSCCSACNYAKRMMSHDQFLLLVARIYHHSVAIGELE